MPTAAQGKPAGGVAKAVVSKNVTVKSGSEGTATKPVAPQSRKPAVKAAPPSPVKKTAGNGAAAKPAAASPAPSPPAITGPPSPVTPKSVPASTAAKAASIAKPAPSSTAASPAAHTETATIAAPTAAAKPAASAAPAATAGEAATSPAASPAPAAAVKAGQVHSPTTAEAITPAAPVAAAAKPAAVEAARAVESPSAATAAPAAATAASPPSPPTPALESPAARPAPTPRQSTPGSSGAAPVNAHGNTAGVAKSAAASSTSTEHGQLATSSPTAGAAAAGGAIAKPAAVTTAVASSAAAAGTTTSRAAPNAHHPETASVNAPGLAAATSSRSLAPVSQAAVEPFVDCIVVKPAPPVPPVKGAPSLKIISAPLRAPATSGGGSAADGEAVTNGPGAVNAANSASWAAPPSPPRATSGAQAASPPPAGAVSAPLTFLDHRASNKQLVLGPPSVVQEDGPVQPSPPSAAVTAVEARGGAAGAAAGCVVVTLEENPGGPCPVEVALAALDPSGSGEVMVADLVTAAIKALKSRYGSVQPGPSVTAVLLEPGGRRRLLPTFDSVPQELLVAAASGGGAGVVLQGVTCGEASQGARPPLSAVSRAPVIPLPGFTEISESGGPGGVGVLRAPSRVTFLSESGGALVQGGGVSDAGGTIATRAEAPPAFLPTRSLLRGVSRSGSGAAAAAGGGGRILGAAHRSVRIRLEENTVETLCVESAAPSATSVSSAFRGARLPPLRGDSTTERHSGPGGAAGAAAALSGGEDEAAPNPHRGKLGITRSSRRLMVPVVDIAAESVGSSEFERAMHPRPVSAIKRDPVQMLRNTESVGADLEARARVDDSGDTARGGEDAGEGAGASRDSNTGPARTGSLAAAGAAAGGGVSPLMPCPGVVKARGSWTGNSAIDGAMPPAASAAAPSSTGKKPALFVRTEADPASGEELEATFYPAPAADWIELMGVDLPDTAEAAESSGCMSCFSSGGKAAQQWQWRERLRTAIETQDDTEVAAWVAFHTGRSGTRNQAELDAVLWLAVEARAPDLVRLLLRGGAQPDAPRPITPVAPATAARTPGSRPLSARVKDSATAVSAAPSGWWPGSASPATVALEGLTPLMRAAELASYAVVEALLSGGANPTLAQPANGWTAVHRAILATPGSPAVWASRRMSPAGPPPTAVASAGSTSSSGSATAGKGAGKGASAGKGDESDASAAALHCLRLLVQRIGLQRAAVLTTAGRHTDDLLRFAVRHGRSSALSWLLSAGLSAERGGGDDDDDDDEQSCAFLAGQLGLTVEVWDMAPPLRRSTSAGPLRDPARPLSWMFSPEERLFADRRRQLLMGAAAGGRVETLASILDKPPPFDRLRRDELEAAIGACRLAQPRNQRTVEELLARKAHSYMAWDREVLPALRRFDEAIISEWIVRDRPLPGDVDRAMAALLSSERLGSPMWQDNATASVQALLDAGADVEHEWDADQPAAPHLAASNRSVKTLRPLQEALLAPSPAVARLLLAAGADARRRDASGDNALFFAVRMAAAAAAAARDFENPDAVREMRMQPSSVSRANSSGRAAATVAAEAAAAECIEVLLGTDCAAELLAARNDDGLTPAVLAALADLQQVLAKLCAAGADPWATPLPAPLGAPEPPRALLPAPVVGAGGTVGGGGATALKRTSSVSAAAGLWSVGHEVARVGALSALAVLLGGPSSGLVRKVALPAVNAEQAAARRREALVGAIRGGRVGAAKMALDADGLGGSLYEADLDAALALCKASAATSALPPPAGTADVVSACGVGAGDPPRYDALAAFLSSRCHVYMSWEGEVLPAIRTANVGVVRRWIAYDKISAADATKALCALVESAQQCNISGSIPDADPDAPAVATTTAAPGCGDGVLLRLSGLSTSRLAAPGKATADVASELVKAGADVNYQQDSSAGALTLLMQVALKGHLPLLEVLLSLGARVDAEDAGGMTAVDHAVLCRARLNDNGCMSALLAAYGARRLNAHRTHTGDSALMLAVRAGDSTAAQLLLGAGATPAAPDASAPASAPLAGPLGGVGGVSRTRSSHFYAHAAGSASGAGAAVSETAATAASEAASRSGPSVSAPSGSVAPSDRSLGTFASGLGRRGSAVYLAARMDDKAMLQQLLRNASDGEGGMDACRQEVQLGALHGGRLTLLEASLALPDLLKAVVGPAEGGGVTALSGAAAVCARLSEQAGMRLAEAQGLTRELEAAAVDAASSSEPAPLSSLDVPRLRRYLAAKSVALESLRTAHGRMGEFYGLARLHAEALEGSLEAKKELVSDSIRDGSDAQVKLMAATTRLTASKDSVLRSVLARRDAQLGRVEALLDKKLAGLNAAQRRAEAKVTSDVEGIILDMRKLVARRLKDIEAKKTEGFTRLGALEHKLDVVWGRRQRLLASRPPAMRVALNQRMGALTQQLCTRREALNDVLAAAVAKMEGGQRRATAMVNMDAMRTSLARAQQDLARVACDAAAFAKATVAERAEDLLRNDKHDQLLRIVGHMQAEVTRGSSSAAATSAKTLAALQQAYAVAMGDLERRVSTARSKMQEYLSSLVAAHSELVKALAVADDAGQEATAAAELAAALADQQLMATPPPDVAKLLLGFEGASALDGVEGVPAAPSGAGGDTGAPDESALSVLRRVTDVEDMIEDMIQDMAAQVLHAFPPDGICDTLSPMDLAPLLEPDSELPTGNLGIERLRQDVASIDFGLPNLDLDVGDLDLSALDDDGGGGMRAFGATGNMGPMGLGMYDIDEEEVVGGGGMAAVGQYGAVGVGMGGGMRSGGAGVGGYDQHRNRNSTDDSDMDTGRGRYTAADYADRHEDDFALSYS